MTALTAEPDTAATILAAARERLLIDGYAGLSTRKVAQQAGVPVSQLHYHFGSKGAMVLALLESENRRRLARQRELFDLVRIDHFRGFEAAWHIPADAPTAATGQWEKSPGRGVLSALVTVSGEGTLVAEDLGLITPEVDALREEFGLRAEIHPHADTHIDTEENTTRFLDATDASAVGLCLDTGHFAYCGGDSVRLIETYGERLGYLHLKQVDPAVLAEVTAAGLPFGPAVRRGVMCEPPHGLPGLPPVLDAARRLDTELFAIVEQDMYPCPPERPLPIARRTRGYLASLGA